MTREKIKTKDIHIRISEDELQMLKNKADSVKLSLTDYLTYCGIGKQIFVVEGLEELNRQHRALGNNINQLARLANSGQIKVVDLSEFLSEYQSIGRSIIELLDRKRWR
jgi:hypothetical protein